jgi:hypothetical protein
MSYYEVLWTLFEFMSKLYYLISASDRDCCKNECINCTTFDIGLQTFVKFQLMADLENKSFFKYSIKRILVIFEMLSA